MHPSRHADTPTVLATWVALLHGLEVRSEDAALSAACAALFDAPDEAGRASAGEALAAVVRDQLGEDEGPEAVQAAARRWFGGRVATPFADDDRALRTQHARAWSFRKHLPWIARIWRREEDGHVHAVWVVVEVFADAVVITDPDPWDDRDDALTLPIPDFQVLWGLSGCAHVAVDRG